MLPLKLQKYRPALKPRYSLTDFINGQNTNENHGKYINNLFQKYCLCCKIVFEIVKSFIVYRRIDAAIDGGGDRKLLSFALSEQDRATVNMWTDRQVVERIYLSDAASKYRDESERGEFLKCWSKAQKVLAPTCVELSGVEPHAINFLKDAFETDSSIDVPTVWSLPMETFNAISRDGLAVSAADMPAPPDCDMVTYFEQVESFVVSPVLLRATEHQFLQSRDQSTRRLTRASG